MKFHGVSQRSKLDLDMVSSGAQCDWMDLMESLESS